MVSFELGPLFQFSQPAFFPSLIPGGEALLHRLIHRLLLAQLGGWHSEEMFDSEISKKIKIQIQILVSILFSQHLYQFQLSKTKM